MPSFRKLGESEILRRSLIRVASARIESPDGETFERDIVHHPGAVVVVPLVTESTVLMIRQYRAAIDGELLEIPAGKRDVDGEPTEVTAARELVEEVGRRPGHLDLLARFYNSPGFSDEYTWLYLATDLTAVAEDRQGVEERYMAAEEVALDDVPRLIDSGELVDAKSIIGLSLTRARLGGR